MNQADNALAPTVSVVVPSFNHRRFVAATIRSIVAQTRAPDELLVIDDGSVDGSPGVIERELGAASFPTRLIVRSNRGLSATLNEGLRLTTGSYFAYVSSDDVWESDRLKQGLAALEGRPDALLSFGAGRIIDEDGRTLATWGRQYHDPDLTLDTLLRFRSIPLSSTVTYRRSAVEAVQWNEQAAMEDYEMYLLLAARGPFVYIDQVLGSWRMHPSNVSKDLPRMLREAISTQRRVAPSVGISPERLARYQACVRFAYGGYFLQAHDWRRGARLTFDSLSGAPSRGALLRRLARTAVQAPALAVRNALDRRSAINSG